MKKDPFSIIIYVRRAKQKDVEKIVFLMPDLRVGLEQGEDGRAKGGGWLHTANITVAKERNISV